VEGKKKIAGILESSDWQGVCFVPSSVLTLRTVGASDGLVIDIGGSGVKVNSVSGGKVTFHSVGFSNISEISGQSKDKANTAWFSDKANSSAICGALFTPKSSQNLVSLAVSVLKQANNASVAGNIVLTGGISQVSGLLERLQGEIGVAYSDFPVSITLAAKPLISAWLGAVDLVNQDPPSFVGSSEIESSVVQFLA